MSARRQIYNALLHARAAAMQRANAAAAAGSGGATTHSSMPPAAATAQRCGALMMTARQQAAAMFSSGGSRLATPAAASPPALVGLAAFTAAAAAARTPAAARLPWMMRLNPLAPAARSRRAASAAAAPQRPQRRAFASSAQPQPQQQPGGGASSSGASSGGGARSPISFNSMLLGAAAFLAAVAVAQRAARTRVDNMMRRSQQVAGRAAVGGPFALIDQDGRAFTHENLRGQWSVLYFGFTHCPDICPDELEKLAAAIDLVERDSGVQLQPVFITVDPARDPPAKVKQYVKEFHPRLIGLTGSEDAVKAVSKAYRVYFHKTTDDPDDYLVDHSIITYLIDPAGEFVTFYGKNFDAPSLAASICGHIEAARGAGEGGEGGDAKAAKKKAAGQAAGNQEGRAQR